MSKVLKLVCDTEESVKNIIITNPKEDVSSEECEAAMQAIAESGAFEGVTDPKKAVLTESNSEIIYEF